MKSIHIGNAAGFWGDNLDAPRRLVEGAGAGAGELDYLTLEYLAELTMSILAHLKSRDGDAGFVTDFPTVVRDLMTGTTAFQGRCGGGSTGTASEGRPTLKSSPTQAG